MPRKFWTAPGLITQACATHGATFVKDAVLDITQAHGRLTTRLRAHPQMRAEDPVAVAHMVSDLGAMAFAVFTIAHLHDITPDQLLAAMRDDLKDTPPRHQLPRANGRPHGY